MIEIDAPAESALVRGREGEYDGNGTDGIGLSSQDFRGAAVARAATRMFVTSVEQRQYCW